MRQEIENPMIKSDWQPMSLGFQEVLMSYHKPVIDMEHFRKRWNDRVEREEAK